MDSDQKTREMVREKYASIARGAPLPVAASCCSTGDVSIAEEGYEQLEGYAKEADLSLGCGVPTAFASLRPGEVVVDLGSGAGNDVFIADAVISNCVLNLVPDKRRAFSEIHRILKPGGRFTVSDIVVDSELPESVRKSAEMWAGCVAGAIRKDEYVKIAAGAGFDVRIEKERRIEIPDDLVQAALGGASLPEPVRVLSITVRGAKRPS
jgi:SAM-dependent methyltransferase